MPSGHHPQAPPGSEYHVAPYHGDFNGAQQDSSSASKRQWLSEPQLQQPAQQPAAAAAASPQENVSDSAADQPATGSVANVLMEAVAQAAAAAER